MMEIWIWKHLIILERKKLHLLALQEFPSGGSNAVSGSVNDEQDMETWKYPILLERKKLHLLALQEFDFFDTYIFFQNLLISYKKYYLLIAVNI